MWNKIQIREGGKEREDELAHTHTHARTHARARARAHTVTHTHTHLHTHAGTEVELGVLGIIYSCPKIFSVFKSGPAIIELVNNIDFVVF